MSITWRHDDMSGSSHFPQFMAATARRAEDGDADAQFDLGLMYSSGDRVALDLVAAHQWFNLAALAGRAEARDLRTEISQDMSLTDIAEAQRRARAWRKRRTH